MILLSFVAFAAKTLEMYYDVMKYRPADYDLRSAKHAVFTTKFNIFSPNLTRESNFFILFISTHNKLSMSDF